MLTDPTYLRYIVDGLESQLIQDNIAALPQGLIGVYEEALPWEHNIKYRGRFLEFFSAWALVKKEVSASFVADLLNWKEQEVIDHVSVYSKWFNSPTSGTYILYHERLRAYLLSKITSDQLNQTNQKVIRSCHHALESRKGDEWEIYALEYLPSHLLIPAMQEKESKANFKKLVYDTSYWNRQLEISKGYDWAKKILNLALGWAAKQNTDELIECALNKIDLHYMEQNDAPRIVELVAENDIETALQRIESFGGNDKEGLQRKFTLYMLCLMELTLLDSRDKPFRKTATEKLLIHLDENIPVDHSLLKWNEFFPSYLMFQMACEWEEMELDYLRVYKRTDNWDLDWIETKGSYNALQNKVLIDAVNCLKIISQKCFALCKISNAFFNQNKFNEAKIYIIKALNTVNEVVDKRARSECFLNCLIAMTNLGEIDEALKILHQIEINSHKQDGLSIIACGLAMQKKLDNALEISKQITNKKTKSETLVNIVNLFINEIKDDQLNQIISEALGIAREIENEVDKIRALLYLAFNIKIKVKSFSVFEIINEAFLFIREIQDRNLKCQELQNASIQLSKYKYYDKSEEILLESLNYFNDNKNYMDNDRIYTDFFRSFIELDKLNDAQQLINKIEDYRSRNSAYIQLAKVLANDDKIDEAFNFVRHINNDSGKNSIIKAILNRLSVFDQFQKSKFYINKLLLINRSLHYIESIYYRERRSINYLLKKGNFLDSIKFIENINDESRKDDLFSYMANEMTQQGNFIMALEITVKIKSHVIKSSVENKLILNLIEKAKLDSEQNLFINELIKNGLNENTLEYSVLNSIAKLVENGKIFLIYDVVMDLVFEIAKTNIDQKETDIILVEAAEKIFKYWGYEKALSLLRLISDTEIKCNALLSMSKELSLVGNDVTSENLINEILSESQGIHDQKVHDILLSEIATVISKLGNHERAIEIARNILFKNNKAESLLNISNSLSENGSINLAKTILLEVIEIIKDVESDFSRVIYLTKIYRGLIVVGDLDKAKEIITQALDITSKVIDLFDKSALQNEISKALATYSDIIQAFNLGLKIDDDYERGDAFKNIFFETVKNGQISQILEQIQQLEKRQTQDIMLEILVNELLKINDYDNSQRIIMMMYSDSKKGLLLKKLIISLINNGQITKAQEKIPYVVNSEIKNSIIHVLAIEFAKQGNIHYVNSIINEVSDIHKKSTIQHDVSFEFIKKQMIKEAIEVSQGIKLDRIKNIILEKIVIELANAKDWIQSEEVAYKISQTTIRQESWKKTANQSNKIFGLKVGLMNKSLFQTEDAQAFYLKGWAESITVDDMSNDLAYKAIQALNDDSISLEKFLQVYAQHEVFFGNPSQEKIARLNKTLNLQWALDIIEQFPKE